MSERNLADELQKALESKRVLEQLLDNKGWNRAVCLVQEQADRLQEEILFTPCAGIDSAMAQEYKKGQLEGRLCLSALIQTEIDVCESTIFNLRRQQNEYGNEPGASEQSPNGGHSAP